jgi:hypothetical protein
VQPGRAEGAPPPQRGGGGGEKQRGVALASSPRPALNYVEGGPPRRHGAAMLRMGEGETEDVAKTIQTIMSGYTAQILCANPVKAANLRYGRDSMPCDQHCKTQPDSRGTSPRMTRESMGGGQPILTRRRLPAMARRIGL